MTDGIPPYRFVGRLKNNRLWASIVEKYPSVNTQADAARAVGESQSLLSTLLNCQLWPYSKKTRRWQPVAKRLEQHLGIPVEDLFDAALYGTELPRISVELTYGWDAKLLSSPRLAMPPSQEDTIHRGEMQKAVDTTLQRLRPRYAQVIRKRFGIGGEAEQTLLQVANEMGIGVERVRQIEARALRTLRHPTCTRQLRCYVEGASAEMESEA